MSLYDGIELGSNEKKSENKEGVVGWSSGLKLLQSQIQLRKATLVQQKREQRTRFGPPVTPLPAAVPTSAAPPASTPGPIVLPTVDLAAQVKVELEKNGNGPLESRSLPLPSGKGNLLFGEVMIEDEYNPSFPNDYEKLAARRDAEKSRQRDDERRREMEEREKRRRERFNREMPKTLEDVDEKERQRDEIKRDAGAAIPPPTHLMEQDQKIVDEPMPPPDIIKSGGPSTMKGLGVAAKIMERYGYRSGAGLGKQEQGMSTALTVEKVSKRGGKIIHEKDKDGVAPGESITDILKNPTKVVLLKNMVGPGEVDEELEPEVKEECSKYGEVIKCTIFQIPDVCEEEAVRIFLEFAKVEQAIKAVVDLNGRFFGGRNVRACFYNLDKFRRFELA